MICTKFCYDTEITCFINKQINKFCLFTKHITEQLICIATKFYINLEYLKYLYKTKTYIKLRLSSLFLNYIFPLEHTFTFYGNNFLFGF